MGAFAVWVAANTWFTLSTWITIASIAYQVVQSKKLREQSTAASEVRKGFETVVEGHVTTLPLVYGRALVGGARVYHKTNGSFKYANSNADKTFSVGPPASAEYVHEGVVIGAKTSGLLNHEITGSKNEFLFVQQAICQGPIERVLDIIINDNIDLDDPSLGTWSDTDGQVSGIKAAMRIDCHNGNTPVHDTIAAANDGQRVSAKFPGAAYASMVFRLDADEPQFQGVPTVQFVIEGRKVRKVAGGVLSTARLYSNNPAWVLLDYLLDNTAGKGIAVTNLDLASFEAAAAICDTVVMPDAVCGGKVWNPIDEYRNIRSRALPLYECNIIIDVAKPIRANVETILGTMGDARLVWSQGKYKLLLQYPASNEEATIAAALTDDDLVMDDQISITWPSSSERLNYATVKFHDESLDFKENSVSWPPKKSGTILRGIGHEIYPVVSGWDMSGSDGSAGGTGGTDMGAQAHELLNSYGVWSGASGSSGTSTMSWKFAVKTTGVHTLKFTADNSAIVTILGATLSCSSHTTLVTEQAAATKDQIVEITAVVTDSGFLKGFAGTIVDSAGMLVWSSRSPAYTDFITVTQSSEVYDLMLAEDNGVNLESDTFGDGITDYYHALAKAEELVRTSRSAFVISFKYLIKDHFFEPGDIIKLDSTTLGLGELYIRVNESKVQDGLVCQITGSRFDWTQLAWNVADNQYIKPKNPYDNKLPAPPWVTYSADSYLYQGSSGSVSWGVVSDTRVVGYIVYAHSQGMLDSKGAPLFTEVGRSSKPPFELPPITLNSGIFGVRSFSSTGAMSSMTMSKNSNLIVGKTPPAITDLTAVSSTTEAKITLTASMPTTRADGSPYDDHAVALIFRGPSTSLEDAVQIGETSNNTFVDLNEVYLPVYYWAKLVTLKGVTGPESNRADSEFNHFGGEPTDSTPPPAPYNLVVEGGYTTMTLRWQNPTVDQFGGTMIRDGVPTYKLGGGHSHSNVYAARKFIGGPTPMFEDASIIGTPAANMFVFARPLGETWYFWVKEVSRGGGVSLTAAGPQFASTAIDVVKTIEALNKAIGESELTTELGAKIEAASSGVTTLNTVVAGQTTSINTVASVASNAAATANSANTTATAAYSAISTTQNTVAGLSAQYTVKVDVNGYVAGFGLAVTDSGTPTSEFQIRADRFSVGQPGYGNINPLIVQTSYTEIDGIPVYPGVYMNDAYIRNGTIVSAKIGKAAVDSLQIKGYAVTVPMFADSPGNFCETSYQYLEAGTLLAGTITYSAGNDANFTGYYATVDILDSSGNIVGTKTHGFSFTSWGSAAFGAGITIPYNGYFKVRLQTFSAGAGWGWGTGCSIYATAAKR